jgi:hypothetical protein
MGARRIIHTVMARGCRHNSLLPRRRCLTGRFLDNPAKQSLASLTLFNSVMAYQGRGCGTKAAYPQSSAGNEVSGTRPDRRRRACWHQAARFVTSPRAPSIAFSRASVASATPSARTEVTSAIPKKENGAQAALLALPHRGRVFLAGRSPPRRCGGKGVVRTASDAGQSPSIAPS